MQEDRNVIFPNGPGNERGCYKSSVIYGISAIFNNNHCIMSTNDHYNINPPGTDRFKKICFHHSKTHWCIMDHAESVAASEKPITSQDL